MDNQYNYYNSNDDLNSNYQYGGPRPGGYNGEQPEQQNPAKRKSRIKIL